MRMLTRPKLSCVRPLPSFVVACWTRLELEAKSCVFIILCTIFMHAFFFRLGHFCLAFDSLWGVGLNPQDGPLLQTSAIPCKVFIPEGRKYGGKAGRKASTRKVAIERTHATMRPVPLFFFFRQTFRP